MSSIHLLRPFRAVFLTAHPIEYLAVRAHLTDISEKIHPKGTIYELGAFSASGQRWEIGITQVGAGNVPAAIEAERAIAYFRPSVILFVGIAGGLKHVQVGDVVVATKVYGYESGKVGATFQTRPEVGNSSYQMVARARAEARKLDWKQRIQGRYSTQTPRVLVEPIAAGEKVVASRCSELCQFLEEHYEDALAVEMESHGFLRAAHANQQVNALIVRGIAYLLSGNRKAHVALSQEVAAYHASAFAFEVLAQLNSGVLDQMSESTYLGPSAAHPSQGEVHYSWQYSDTAQEAIALLKRGQHALLRESYTIATQYLGKAVQLLHEDEQAEESAQARYLLALASLNGTRPFGVKLEIMHHIEELMQDAISLHPSFAYLYTFALFKRDFARNGWQQSRYVQAAQELLSQANLFTHSAKDNEHLTLLSRCQPHLMRDAAQW